MPRTEESYQRERRVWIVLWSIVVIFGLFVMWVNW